MEAAIQTDLQSEIEAQRRWRLLEKFSGAKRFDRLVENEFRDPEEQQARTDAALQSVIQFAATEVPYYRDLMAATGLRADDIRTVADLPRLPLLDKVTVRHNTQALQPGKLPLTERLHGVMTSSGSTGAPTRIPHTRRSVRMFSVLAQRSYRWFRLDPMGTFAYIRLADQLPRRPGRRYNRDGATLRLDRWRHAGEFFETGRWIGFNVTNPVAAQIDWLANEQPRYLATYSETLEHICLASGDVTPAESIAATMAISEQLTPAMRRRVEQTFGGPVFRPYGLNEIGAVATRCAAGRYHVHTEHCLVEVADEDGQPARPGTRGRILVTALNNPAMPLIRYDTDDLAEAVDGPCPCGRTLPAFGDIQGRYSRIAFLPEGTLTMVGAVRSALEHMPRALARPLRKFQLHQDQANHFVLRLAVASPLDADFARRILTAWREAGADRDWPLEIVEVDDIPLGPGGKFQDFTSDHMPKADEAEPATPARVSP